MCDVRGQKCYSFKNRTENKQNENAKKEAREAGVKIDTNCAK